MDIKGRNFIKFAERQKDFAEQYSKENTEKQHSKGKLTARERISLLFDEDTFEEIDAFATPSAKDTGFGRIKPSFGDGVIIGHGKISNRLTFAYAQDFNIMGGSLGSVHAKKIAKIQDMALKMGAPMIGIIDSEVQGFRRELPVWQDMPVFFFAMFRLRVLYHRSVLLWGPQQAVLFILLRLQILFS